MPKQARPAGARIREIRSATDPAFGHAYRLLTRIFPRAELLPKRDWIDVMRERDEGLWTDLNWHLLVAERGGKTVGAASGSYVGNVNVGIIGYIAVRREARAARVGPRLRQRLCAAFRRDARRMRRRPLDGIVGEVRADNPWLRQLVRATGAIALDFPYYQPSLAGRGLPVPLVLYYQPLRRRRRWLSGAEVRRLLYTMWRRPYRIAKPLSRPAFRRMMRHLAGRRRIGQRALLPPGPAGNGAIA